jgi:hypothetical protein
MVNMGGRRLLQTRNIESIWGRRVLQCLRTAVRILRRIRHRLLHLLRRDLERQAVIWLLRIVVVRHAESVCPEALRVSVLLSHGRAVRQIIRQQRRMSSRQERGAMRGSMVDAVIGRVVGAEVAIAESEGAVDLQSGPLAPEVSVTCYVMRDVQDDVTLARC